MKIFDVNVTFDEAISFFTTHVNTQSKQKIIRWRKPRENVTPIVSINVMTVNLASKISEIETWKNIGSTQGLINVLGLEIEKNRETIFPM